MPAAAPVTAVLMFDGVDDAELVIVPGGGWLDGWAT